MRPERRARQAARRRRSRASASRRRSRARSGSAGRDRRRGGNPHRRLVAWVALATAFVAATVTGLFAWLAFDSNRHIEADAARKQQFVDTASQTVVNMFSYNQN